MKGSCKSVSQLPFVLLLALYCHLFSFIFSCGVIGLCWNWRNLRRRIFCIGGNISTVDNGWIAVLNLCNLFIVGINSCLFFSDGIEKFCQIGIVTQEIVGIDIVTDAFLGLLDVAFCIIAVEIELCNLNLNLSLF